MNEECAITQRSRFSPVLSRRGYKEGLIPPYPSLV